MDTATEFPVVRQWAYFDHAAVAPLPRRTSAALVEYAERMGQAGLADIHFWVARVRHVRELAARLIHAPTPEDLAFVPNTTTAIGFIAEGFPWQPGDNVVLAAEEYPSNQYPWMNAARRFGFEVRTVPSRAGQLDPADYRAAIDARTRLLSVSAVQFATGFRADLPAFGQLAREHGLFFFVDGIQALGAFPVDVQAAGIDALAADGHKWLLAPEGAGLLYIRREWLERLHPFGVGAHSVREPFNYGSIQFELVPHAGRYEGGALNLPGISALGASLELFEEVGPARVTEQILHLTDYLCEAAPHAGLTVYSPRMPRKAASGVVSLIPTRPGIDPVVIQKACRAAGIMINVRVGRLRVSPHFYNTTAEIDRFLGVARSITAAT